MGQVHKRFTDEQIRMLFQRYRQGQLSQGDMQELFLASAAPASSCCFRAIAGILRGSASPISGRHLPNFPPRWKLR